MPQVGNNKSTQPCSLKLKKNNKDSQNTIWGARLERHYPPCRAWQDKQVGKSEWNHCNKRARLRRGLYAVWLWTSLSETRLKAWFCQLRISKEENRKHFINLLLIADDEKKHYCLINNMSRLLPSQTSKYKEAKQYCLRWLNHFSSKEKLALHKGYCSRMRQSGSRFQTRIA